ncbi:helix-turn-helix domain-containing protein [Deinococcus cavernae]|uniref:helix-turn-helix domain-containing protein n=1 Tax=Deinococcus cavernae TaxID=2320857 RepID=UPI001314D068|nr:helix-turn-helix transcriptional regulator [Deinococcus cavernae]
MKGEGESVAVLNVRAALRQWLTHGAGHGASDDLSRRLRVTPSTLSRWKAGQVNPQPRHLEALARDLALPVDFETMPYFETGHPLVHAARVREVQRLAGQVSEQALAEVFPALVRLLR